MQGILIVDKPQDFTSFDVVAKLRGICGTRRIGHSGTLDPMATGVLPVFIGNAAKAVDLQTNHDKTYEAVMQLGIRTDTGDVTGTTLETADVPSNIDAQAVQNVLAQFVGEGEQVPPMYSAVKINGQPLYKAARAGKTVERKARPIVIYSIDFLDSDAKDCYTLRIHCGKGTYVRVLLEDIGKALGVPATMRDLRRTQAGVYTLQHAHTFAEIQQAKDNGTLEQLLTGVDTVFAHLPRLDVSDSIYAKLYNGVRTNHFPKADGTYATYHHDAFIGTCAVQDSTLRGVKLFIER